MKPSLRRIGVARLLRWGSALLSRSGHTGLVMQLFKAADELAPADIPAYTHAHALWQDGYKSESRTLLEKILAKRPDHPEANNLLGVLLLEEGNAASARAYFNRALKARPEYAAPQNNLGNIHLADGAFDEAAKCYRAVLAHTPDYVEALTNLGSVCNLQGNNKAAELYCRKAVELAPGFAGAQSNLGNVLMSLGRVGEAIACYREALRLVPGLPEALINLALATQDVGYLPGAIDYYEKQAERRPNDYLPHIRIAQALQALGSWDEAAKRLNHVLEIKPDSTEALVILSANYDYIGDIPAGIGYLHQVLEAEPNNGTAQARIAFDLMYLSGYSGEQICAAYRDWAELHATRPMLPLLPLDSAMSERTLRIGYMSRDFAKHSVAYFLEPIIRHHDRAKFEVYCYSTLIEEDDQTEQFKNMADNWRNISTQSEQAIVELVRQDQIDILVDLSGHTSGNRLSVFAYKPAPVQVEYLGHPATSGLTAIDYRIGDAISDPRDLVAGHYTETLWQLPGCFLTYQPEENAPPVQITPPSTAAGRITFGSFNNLAKVNDLVIEVWAKVLHAVPASRLLLKSFALNSERGRARVLKGFAKHGVPPERLELVSWRPDKQNHLEVYNEVDIALDTFPYNGTTTTCEAMWMGVPVICLEGERHSARVGASLLNAIGLQELLAKDIEEFVQKAVQLAADSEELGKLRAELRDRIAASVLLDHAGFTRNLESAYREMWRAYCTDRQHEIIAHGEDGISERKGQATLDLAGVAKICLPASYEVMSRYVIEEQGDWFEDEIRFVRKLLNAGETAIDVGANYGVYTLSMAALVGSAGKIYAFEPDAATAGFLQSSLAENGFKQVEVVERAVSDSVRRGYFQIENNSELNRLLDSSESELGEGVEVTTLDYCREEFGWGEISFIKIDAEGQEPQVVRGAARLLTDISPLVMAEYKHGMGLNFAMLEEFDTLAYKAYQLVPGLMLLAPLENPEEVDSYLLNLFFCKDDKAHILSERGLLVPHGQTYELDEQKTAISWGSFAAMLDYVDSMKQYWSRDADGEYAQALNYYAMARKLDVPAAVRLASLKKALSLARSAVAAEQNISRRLSLARILADLGLRDDARKEFEALYKLLQQSATVSNEPYLAPLAEFENIRCSGDERSWQVAAVSMWLAKYEGFSSFFVGEISLRYWQVVRETGYCLPEAQRQIELFQCRRRGAAHYGAA